MGRHIENSCQDPNLIENKRKMIWSLFLITVILIAKLTGAFFTRSLALLSDSWHLVTDLTSLLISYWGLRMAAIPATNCLAPVAKVLNDNFGIKRGVMTTTHAYTNDQRVLDLAHKDLRRARAAAQSMIPTTTGAAKAVALVLPELKGKLTGIAVRVPTPNVSLVDLVTELEKSAEAEEINQAFKDAAAGNLKGILAYSDIPLVSRDYNGDPHSAIVDGPCTLVMGGNLAKVFAWYDNEWAYSVRVIDCALFVAEKGF
jgi:glyceraldehyde 3-phosphate dehydrogenase